ncbi:glycosyltransferase [Cellvibrio sp. NN19]|uniref:glycosyltransferase n=1 Tax=Cellvibrio chitinivorans TaxID=3102792 RepID=UPI002B40F426|nr:glycosyltransferase [Cellvibrio sp. NN19]
MKYKFLSIANDIWYFYARPLAAILLYLSAKTLLLLNFKRASISFSLATSRYKNISGNNILLKSLLGNSFSDLDASKGVQLKEASGRSIILRWPEIDQNNIFSKGVLLITFTKTFSYFIRNIDIQQLHKYFYIVLEPSWSGYADPDILGFFNKNEKVIIQSSEIQDRILLNHFLEYCIPVSFGASDWVNPDIFIKNELPKIYDSVYIANTNPIKRVYRYLKAIKNIVERKDPNYKACLVCASWGGAEELLKELVESFKLEKNLKLLFSQSRSQVINILNQSKVNILLSLKEGSNRSLFEALFCGTPVILASENIGVNKAYINEHTGLLLDNSALEDGLCWMKENYTLYDTRSWAMENISPNISTQKLCAVINNNFNTSIDSLFVKTNSPEVCYLNFDNIDHAPYSMKVLELFITNNSNSHSDTNKELLLQKELFFQSIEKKKAYQ